MKLEMQNVSKSAENRPILNRVSFSIPACNTVAILGPSGSGKSTLLRLLAGLDYPDAGAIRIDQQEIVFKEKELLQHRRKMGIVFQALNLFPHLTVLENIELPLHYVHNLSMQEATGRAMHFLHRFHLQEHAHKKPSQLSGGQSQRVAIVRAIATKAKLFLLDEPTSALDPLMTSEVLDLILELRAEGVSIVLVSHHMGFVREIADWVIFLDKGQVIEYAPTAHFFSAPKTPQAQRFLEKVLKH